MIGGGIIGLEMATVYDALGSQVTVVELLDQLIPGCDPDLVRAAAQADLRSATRRSMLGTEVRSVKALEERAEGRALERRRHELFDGSWSRSAASPTATRSTPPRPASTSTTPGFIAVDAQLRTNVPGIYAIGDIVGGPMLAHKASHEGKVAAEVIAGVPGAEFDARAIPSVAYTDPEVAWMGLTETDARAAGIEYEKAVFPWAASGRALSLGRDEGLTKLLFEPGLAAAARRRHRRRGRRRADRRDRPRARDGRGRRGHRRSRSTPTPR